MRRGFTLVELLTCMVIVALLATAAVPSWRAVMVRAQRNDAVQALYAVAAAQERYRLVHGRYASAASPPPPDGLGLGTSQRGWYTLRIEEADANSFVASARPTEVSLLARDTACRMMTIDQAGKRGSSPEPRDKCWP